MVYLLSGNCHLRKSLFGGFLRVFIAGRGSSGGGRRFLGVASKSAQECKLERPTPVGGVLRSRKGVRGIAKGGIFNVG